MTVFLCLIIHFDLSFLDNSFKLKTRLLKKRCIKESCTMAYKLLGIIFFLSFATLFEACVIGENSFSFIFRTFSFNSFFFVIAKG